MSKVEILPQVAAFLERRHGCFIDGQWVLPDGPTTPVLNPATGEAIAQVPDVPLEYLDRVRWYLKGAASEDAE